MLDEIQKRDGALIEANKELEGKVAARTADLEEMVGKLNQSNRQLQEFTYVASHDLREPLRKISAFGQLLIVSIGDKIEDDDRENLDFMIDGAERMQRMIEALLTYSRVTTKEVEFETVDLNKAVEDLQEFELSVKLEETKTNLIVPEPLHQASCDPAQVRQLLQNLIANGLKYQKQGNIPEITIRSHMQDDGMVRVEVQDNGIGIEKDQCENVFVMFRRLHSRQEYEGTGIGLAICKKIVERHGGNIGIDSVYGEGSTFWFTMPSAQASAIEANSQADIKAVV
jgi:light-regulated signal transduction histidine kinase (bacteriophytochrome)